MTISIDHMTERPVAPTYASQTALGRDKADDLIVKIRMTRNPTLLGFAVRDIVTAGVYGPMEIGFCQRLADQILD